MRGETQKNTCLKNSLFLLFVRGFVVLSGKGNVQVVVFLRDKNASRAWSRTGRRYLESPTFSTSRCWLRMIQMLAVVPLTSELMYVSNAWKPRGSIYCVCSHLRPLQGPLQQLASSWSCKACALIISYRILRWHSRNGKKREWATSETQWPCSPWPSKTPRMIVPVSRSSFINKRSWLAFFTT